MHFDIHTSMSEVPKYILRPLYVITATQLWMIVFIADADYNY